MSQEIDNHIVQMEFRNDDFEKNVTKTRNSLQKLKSDLNFDGCGKGLKDLSDHLSGNTSGLNSMASAVQTLSSKFDFLDVLQYTVFSRMASLITDCTSKLIYMFGVQPVSSGWSEYELKMGSIQTIMASTGEDLETVNSYLEELNKYADQTIYSFSDMTSNIGKFTNAGVSLNDAVAAIKGISNEAALSGANAANASHAMYNFAQALSAGYVKLIDWKSIENANMATKEFKEQLLETAKELNTVADAGDGYYQVLTQSGTGSTMSETISATKNFNDSLQYQWMTTEVLTQTLAKYASTEEDIGIRANKAATEVKTFSQMMDALKEAAGSGWATTFELIFGNFEEGRDQVWTPISEVAGAILDAISNVRNGILRTGLQTYFGQFEHTITDAGYAVDEFKTALDSLLSAQGTSISDLENEFESLDNALRNNAISIDTVKAAYANMVGKTGKSTTKLCEELSELFTDDSDAAEEFTKTLVESDDALSELYSDGVTFNDLQNDFTTLMDAGYLSLDKVNTALEKLGFSALSAEEPISEVNEEVQAATESVEKLQEAITSVIRGDYGNGSERFTALEEAGYNAEQIQAVVDYIYERNGQNWSDCSVSAEELSEYFSNLSDEEKASIGITDENADALANLASSAELTEEQLRLLEKTMNADMSGREYLISGFSNILTNLKMVSEAVLSGFTTVFGDHTITTLGDGLHSLCKWFANVTEVMVMTSDDAENLNTIFTGVWSAVHLLVTLFGGQFKFVFNTVGAVLNHFNLTWLDAVAIVAEYVTAIDTAITESGIFEKFTKYAGDAVVFFIDVLFKGVDAVKTFGKGVSEGFSTLTNNVKSLLFMEDATEESSEAVSTNIGNMATAIGAALDNTETTSEEKGHAIADAIVENTTVTSTGAKVIDTVLTTFTTMLGQVTKMLGGIGKVASEGFYTLFDILKRSEISINTIIGSIIAGGVVKMSTSVAELGENVTAAIRNLTNTIMTFGIAMNNYGKAAKYKSLASVLGMVAVVILSLAASLWLLSKVDIFTLVATAGVLGALMVGLATFVAQVSALIKTLSWEDIGKLTLLGVAVSALGVGLLAFSAGLWLITKLSDGYNWDSILLVFATIAGIFFFITHSMTITTPSTIAAYALLIEVMSNAVFKMALFCRIIGALDEGAILKGGIVMTGMAAFMTAMIILIDSSNIISSGKQIVKAIAIISAMTTCLLLLAIVCRICGGMDIACMVQGILVMQGFMKMMKIMVKITDGYASIHAGSTLIAIAGAMVILALCVHILGGMDIKNIIIGETALVGLVGIVALLAKVTGASSRALSSAAKLSTVIATLTLCCFAISLIDPVKSIAGATALAIMMYGLHFVIDSIANMDSETTKSVKAIAKIVVITGSMVGLVAAIKKVTDNSSYLAVATFGIVMYALAKVIKVTAQEGQNINKKKIMNVCGTMAAVVGTLAVMFGMISAMGITVEIATVEAISKAILPLSIAVWILSKADGINSGAVMSAVIMGAVMMEIAQVLGVLSIIVNKHGDVNNLVPCAIAMGVLINALAASCIILSKVNKGFNSSALLFLGSMVAVMYVLSGVMVLMSKIKAKNLMDAAGALATLILALSVAVIPISLAGMVPQALLLNGIKNLAIVLGATGLLAIIGGVISLNDKISSTLLNGLDLIGEFVIKLAGIIGKCVSTFVVNLFSELPKLATYISEFGANLEPFWESVKAMPSDAAGRTATLMAAVLGIIAADTIGTLASYSTQFIKFFGLGASFSKTILNFGNTMVKFADSISGFSDRDVNNIKVVTEASTGIGSLLKACSIWKTFTFNATFSTTMTSITDGLKTFCTAFEGVNVDLNKVKVLAEVANAIASMQNAFGLLDGWTQKITGHVQTGDQIKNAMQGLANGIKYFCNEFNYDNFKFPDDEVIDTAIDIATKIAGVYDTLPKVDGIAQGLKGTPKDLETFGTEMAAIARSIVTFSTTISVAKQPISDDVIDRAIKIAESLGSIYELMPKVDGYLQTWGGSTDKLDSFGETLEGFAKGLVKYCDTLWYARNEIKTASSANDLVATLAKLVSALATNNCDINSVFNAFFAKLPDCGKKFTEFANSVKDVDESKVQDAIDKLYALYTATKVFQDSNTDRLIEFADALKSLSTDAIQTFCDNMSGEVAQGDVDATMTSFMDYAAGAITSKCTTLLEAVESVINSMVNKFESSDMKSKFKSAGETCMIELLNGFNNDSFILSDSVGIPIALEMIHNRIESDATKEQFFKDGLFIVEGFVNGIRQEYCQSILKAAGAWMSDVVEEGEREESDTHSPSRVFEKLGGYLPMGLINGIKSMGTAIYDAGAGMADEANNGISDALNLTSIFDDNIDANPVIRPFLDLSEIQNGSSALNSMFRGASIGINAANVSVPTDNMVELMNTLNGMSGSVGNTTNMNNTFNVSGDNPKAIANEISHLLNKQVERRNAAWA